MSEFLVATDGHPENVVRDAVAVEKLHCTALLHRKDVRLEHQMPLLHNWLLRRNLKSLSSNRFDIDYGGARNSRHFAANRTRLGSQAKTGKHHKRQ